MAALTLSLLLLAILFIPVAAVLLLFFPLRRFRMAPLFAEHWDGAVPWQVLRVGDEPLLLVRGVPYPGDLRPDGAARRSVSLDGTWRFRLDANGRGDSEGWHAADLARDDWTPVAVPGTFNPAESEHTSYLGVAWYARSFALEEPGDGMRARLAFAGLLLRGRVWLNGVDLGEFEGGYTTQFFDCTGLLLDRTMPGQNVLVVAVDNRLTPDSLPPRIKERHNPGWHTYGGIHRSVELQFVPPEAIVSLRTSDDGGQLWIRAITEHHGKAGPWEARSLELSAAPEQTPAPGVIAATPVAGLDAAEGRPALALWEAFVDASELPRWSPESPRRLDLRARLLRNAVVVDSVRASTGLRAVTVAGERLQLDGTPLLLRGICRHEDHPVHGASLPTEVIRADHDLIAGMHANFIRRAHYPHSLAELEEAEVRGLLQVEEIPVYQAGSGFTAWKQEREPWRRLPVRLFGIRQTRRPEFLAHARRQLMELIERDRLRPSLIYWGTGNESYTLGRRAGAVFARLADIARDCDRTRPVTYVELSYNIPVLDRLRRGWRGADIASLNSYYGWYYGEASGLSAHLDRARRLHAGKPLILSEFGAGAAPGRSSADGPWQGERIQTTRTYGEDYQAEVLRQYWEIAGERPEIVGVSPWVFADFYNIWFPSNPVPNFNLKGVVSADRVPKQGYHLLATLYAEAAGASGGSERGS